MDTTQKISNFPRAFSRGISLIELVIVVAITGLLVTISVLPFTSFNDQQALSNAEDSIGAFIIDARTRTLSSYNNDRYGIHFSASPTAQSSQIIMFKGATYTAGTSTNVILPLSDNAKITGVSLQGGGVDMIFNRLTGGTDQYGTITLQVTPAKTIYTRTITINKAGAVSIN
jgi:Tfp pilus assembly protein FimT